MSRQQIEYKRVAQKFRVKGINLSAPVDLLPPGYYRALENVRPYGEAQIAGRQGLSPVMTGGALGVPIHSLKRLNDPVPSPSAFPTAFNQKTWFAGASTDLHCGIYPALPFTIDSGYSGNPLLFVTAKGDNTPRPFMFIPDSLKMRKCASSFNILQWGVQPPNDPPTAAITGANPDGPDIGVDGQPYLYRYRGRCDSNVHSGAWGNAGPPMRMADGISAHQQNIRVTVTVVHPDPDVAKLDIFRYGGSLTNWIYVGTISNFAGSNFVDTFSDDAIAANPQLEFDNFQPFPTYDQPATGTCTVAGNIVTRTAGDAFKPIDLDAPYWGFGNQIIIGNQTCTLYRAPTDANTLEIVEDGVTSGTFTLPSPQLWHSPLAFCWGPFGGGSSGTFIFAVGDKYRPHAIYWTKGNRPESAPDVNVLEITTPSEPLQNGCMYAGQSWVFSTERLYMLMPNFGGTSDFVAIEVPNSKGLFGRWCLCVAPDGIYFLSRDGIYKSSGGTPTSITDRDLYTIFPHEGALGTFTADGQAPVPGSTNGIFAPPDFTQETALRLAYSDGFIYFTYKEQGTGTLRTLVYNILTDGWCSRDTYNPSVVFHYAEEGDDLTTTPPGETDHNLFMGSTTGSIYNFAGGAGDAGGSITGRVRTGSVDDSDPRPRKLWGDILFDFQTDCETFDVTAGFENFTFFSVVTLTGTNFNGRRRAVGDIGGGLGQFASNIGLDIQWTTATGRPVLYFWEPSYIPKPELTILRATDWTDDGNPGAKFFQGLRIRGDSLGVTRTLQIQADGGGVLTPAISFNASNERWLVYSFPVPFISHLVRIVPSDPNFWRLFEVQWIWEPAPDLASNWITQGTTHNLQGFWYHRDARIALVSFSPVTFTFTRLDDSTLFPYTIPSTSGVHQKPYLVLQNMKSKIGSYSAVSDSPFRLFIKDTEIRIKQWGGGGPFQSVQPFGDISREKGAVI